MCASTTKEAGSTWRKVGSVTVPGADLHSYVSSATGLRALLAKTDEPLCSMHMAIATEADTNEWSHKDDGLPPPPVRSFCAGFFVGGVVDD